MPLKKLFQNIHGFCSQPSAPSVFMAINPHHKPKHKLPYVELRGHRSLPGYGVRGCCPERLVAVDSGRIAPLGKSPRDSYRYQHLTKIGPSDCRAGAFRRVGDHLDGAANFPDLDLGTAVSSVRAGPCRSPDPPQQSRDRCVYLLWRVRCPTEHGARSTVRVKRAVDASPSELRSVREDHDTF